MRTISNTTRSVGYGETSGETGDIATSFTGKDFYQELIQKANTVPLVRLFKHYGLRLDENNRKITCPFSAHKGGRENTGSFNYYPHTNTFWCFGCKVGVYACDFVANMDGCNKVKAANKILDLFHADADDDNILDKQNFSEKLEIMMDFSNTVREFIRSNPEQKDLAFIENICMVYDTMNLKHNLNNDALRSMIKQLKEKIDSYIKCPML